MTHANAVNIHHNQIYSRVTEIECRHYPGNALMRVYTYGGDIHIHDNQFFSNDLFFNSGWEVNMTIKLEDNTFTLLKEPFATERESCIFDVGEAFEKEVRVSRNTFIE